MKKENGRRAAAVRLTPKLAMMSGTIGPRILVSSDITKKTRKTMPTMDRFLDANFLSMTVVFIPGVQSWWLAAIAPAHDRKREADRKPPGDSCLRSRTDSACSPQALKR